jgi:hypothetical protein
VKGSEEAAGVVVVDERAVVEPGSGWLAGAAAGARAVNVALSATPRPALNRGIDERPRDRRVVFPSPEPPAPCLTSSSPAASLAAGAGALHELTELRVLAPTASSTSSADHARTRTDAPGSWLLKGASKV